MAILKPALSAINKMSNMRARLLLDSPWFGALAMRLQIIEVPGLGTMAVDGTNLFFDPEFLTGKTDREIIAVVAHEVMHCACRHMYRRGDRDPELFNMACDYAINPILKKTGFTLPDGALLDPQYDDMPAEQIYSRLMQQRQKSGNGNGPGKPCPTGEFRDPPKPESKPGKDKDKDKGGQPGKKSKPGSGPSDKSQDDGDGQDDDDQDGTGQGQAPKIMQESDWEVATQQATMTAHKAGNLPGALKGFLQASKGPQADWRVILRQFIENTLPSDYSWNSPNKRYMAHGLYLPGVVRENTPKIVALFDTSGSIWGDQPLMTAITEELAGILSDCKPESLTVIYCDTRVTGIEEFTPDDDFTLTAKGGGGTYFQPAFDEVEKLEERPACVIYFTDMMSADTPKEIEGVPTLWAIPEAYGNSEIPFGEKVVLNLS